MADTAEPGFRKMRKAAQLTQTETAKRVGITTSTISKWETGRSAPTPAQLRRLAQVLNCSPNDLLQWTDPAKESDPLLERIAKLSPEKRSAIEGLLDAFNADSEK